MSLEAFFKGMAITTALAKRKVPGVTEICPANASYQVKFDPDVTHPSEMMKLLQQLERDMGSVELELNTRIIEVPVLYNDPWTQETLMRFRERHQEPTSTDIQYAARINHFKSVDEFIVAHSGSPWFVSMVGFVAGLPFLFQLVERARQIEVRSTCALAPTRRSLQSVTAAASGVSTPCAVPAATRCSESHRRRFFDPAQALPYFKDFMCLFRPGTS